MALGCRILTRRGLVEGFGHLSVRLADGVVLITPRKALLMVEADEIVRLDASGKQTGGSGSPPVESHMHLAVYRRRPDVGAIARTHSPLAAAFAAMGRPVRALHGFGTHLGEEVPVYPEVSLVSTAERGASVVDALGDRPATLLRGNGTLVTGPDLTQAVMRAIWLEESAGIQWRIQAAGGHPIFFTPEEVAARQQMDMPHEPVRAWEFEVAMLRQAGWV